MLKKRKKIDRLRALRDEHRARDDSLVDEIVILRADVTALKKQVQSFVRQKKSQNYIDDSNHEESFKQ